jgi:acyl-CoA reductase-like NAD-dependent aldehyde dehydrogenase
MRGLRLSRSRPTTHRLLKANFRQQLDFLRIANLGRSRSRIAILHRLSVLLEGKREHFGLQIAREGGKPLTDALIKVDRAIDVVRNAADMLRVAAGQEIPMGLTRVSVDRRAFTIREPIRVRLSNRGR